nr:CusA/CzcA family heavy metal efflux RND transporter [uncultured Carboxylicivirga sp.]
MLEKIIDFSVKNKLIVILFTLTVVGFGLFSVLKIPVGTVPDITNNQVQIITTSGNLSTQEIEQFITAPVEMEMANLPGVEEIRSVSKFGISLVTVVFEDKLGTYLPRQLIAEKIKVAATNIPEAYGAPDMGPISTGLGEIYQYILDVKPGYEDRYSPMDLRTIQDWIVKRRLSGINGVVEVNSWGGYLKQYEVAINPSLLKSMDLTLMEVFNALESNNSISGGAYIEKTNQSYFIRGDGQVKSIPDIEKIVIANKGGHPVLIKDVAKVHFGYANRFGAITANGKGETILGQIMMLKNADSKEVIQGVHNRVEEIQSGLPEGVFINPILERGELIGKTSTTVAENLILGAIIVLFTVILLLGNWRSALVIASMIPLALFFTISMMYIFGIDANLMSLGALDFGIIIDGAVIIVEYIALKMNLLGTNLSNSEERQKQMDQIANEGASKMMKSAIFGQIIILIVFIPILSLQGVEGKMFHPMALAFSFAIIGAMIMGLTWLPVASSLFLKPVDENKKTISKRLMKRLHIAYEPSILWACRNKKIVLGIAILSLIATGVIFTRIGGEFVPTLDEGDFVIQPVLKTGTSLSKTVETTTRMEQILMKEFPDEVDQIVSRIGAAEVPTDPMSMEEVDMIIKLNPKSDWVAAGDKEELAEKFKEALSIIPGIEYEFTQPIEMRFNELITGVRSDIAIKIYGEDLDYINEKANEIKKLITDVPGAGDIILEKTTGLPQIKVDYKRDKIAYYGVDIATLNAYLSTAFGGQISGVVFEGEKRFDMVVRLQDQSRTDIADIRRLMVPVSSGQQIPLAELAEIEYTKGPAKISRENTRRRVVVAVNVRNRDLQSVIEDIQVLIDQNIKLTPGNYIEYGGQFENLQNATNRLMLAVPVSLLLIFIFLHFAFKSLKDAIMIFTAIPLATVGGVFLLWLRGMPFSVSAGVGFIALFGIAVLNGIVLIEHLKELLHENGGNIKNIIVRGTKDRLRPVLLTAGAAAMGFLPMAISTGAGAEVQRPLATVVIGGLITSTLLTLIALPLLFEIFYNVERIQLFPFKVIRSKGTAVLIGLMLLSSTSIMAQKQELKLDQVIEIAINNNKQVKASELEVEKANVMKGTAFSPDKTTIAYSTDENNIAENGYPLKVWGVEQRIDFPGLYVSQGKMRRLEVDIAETEMSIQKSTLQKEVSLLYYELQMLQSQLNIYRQLDSVLIKLEQFNERRYEVKDISQLDLLNIKAKKNRAMVTENNLNSSIDNTLKRLKVVMNYDEDFTIPVSSELVVSTSSVSDSLLLFKWFELQNQHAQSLVKVEKNKMLPDITFNYFIGSNSYENAQNYQGFEVGLAIPLFFGNHSANIKAAKLTEQSQSLRFSNQMDLIKNELEKMNGEQKRYATLIDNYNQVEKPLADEMMRTALKAYQLGGVSFYELSANLEEAINIQMSYFENVFNYNRISLEMKYYSNY